MGSRRPGFAPATRVVPIQTVTDLRALSAALYCAQFVVWYLLRIFLTSVIRAACQLGWADLCNKAHHERSVMPEPKPKSAVTLVQLVLCAMVSIARRMRQMIGFALVLRPTLRSRQRLHLTRHSTGWLRRRLTMFVGSLSVTLPLSIDV